MKRATNWGREVSSAEQANPYARPVLAGPWWLGFNDARARRPYWNDYVTRVSRYEYQQGYLAGCRVEGRSIQSIINAAHAEATE